MNRRHFLSLFALLGVSSLFSGTVSWVSSTQNGAGLRDVKPYEELEHLQSTFFYDVQKIGTSYLRAHPDETNRERLANDIRERKQRTEAKERRSLDLQVRMDFASNRTVRVNGWILSHTEARLCALAVLS